MTDSAPYLSWKEKRKKRKKTFIKQLALLLGTVWIRFTIQVLQIYEIYNLEGAKNETSVENKFCRI